MKVGFFSPMPPAPTGVADYSETLLSWFRQLGAIEISPDKCDVALYHLGTNILHHPSLPILALFSAIALAILGWKETHRPRVGLALGAFSGLIALLSALYVYFNPSPVNMEHDLQTLFLGLSPVTWLLLIEIVTVAALLYLSRRPAAMLLLPALVWLILALFSSPQLFPFRLPLVGYMDAVTLASGAWLPTALLSAYTLTSLALERHLGSIVHRPSSIVP